MQATRLLLNALAGLIAISVATIAPILYVVPWLRRIESTVRAGNRAPAVR